MQLNPWASASLCDPVRLAASGSRRSSSSATEETPLCHLRTRACVDEGGLISLLKSYTHKGTLATRDILLWSTSLIIGFRLLTKAEAHLFELGLESWALQLTRLRAKITEAFLQLSLQSQRSTSVENSFGSVHPAVSLLEASLNIQIFRGAMACGFLNEAQELLPLFSPSAIRSWTEALGQVTEACGGLSKTLGRQACCLSVVTLQRTCSLISIGELLITLGEQCLLIGEVGLSSVLGCSASSYLPSLQDFKDCNPNLFTRQVTLLASSRFRQGDVNGSLELLDTVTSLPNFAELEVPVALNFAEALWVGSMPLQIHTHIQQTDRSATILPQEHI